VTVPDVAVTCWFGNTTTGASQFILDDPVRGVLDNVTYVLSGDAGTDLTGYCNSFSVQRGKTSPLFGNIDPASGSFQLNNESRLFDPLYAAGVLYGSFKPGKRVTLEILGVTVFDGRVSDWTNSYEVSGRSVTTGRVEDLLGSLGRQLFDAWTPTDNQLSGARVIEVLDRPEVLGSASRDIAVGKSSLQGEPVALNTNVLNYLQTVANSEQGLFFCSREGVLTFRGRDSVGAVSAAVTLSDAGPLYYHAIQVEQTGDTYYTKVTVEAVNIPAMTITEVAAAQDGVRAFSISGLLQDSQQQVIDMTTFLGATYSNPDPSISELTVELSTEQYPGLLALGVLAIELGTTIQVSFTPNGVGAAISQRLIVDGIRYDVTPHSCRVTFTVSAAAGRTMFTLDSTEFGVLDGSSLLGY
jgi:hypothetical protein